MIARNRKRMARPRKDASAAAIPAFRFTDAEIAALADMALAAWESGVEHATTDRLGAVWTFLPRHDDPPTRLEVTRTYQGAAEALRLTGAELGVDQPAVMLASRILALVEPHVRARNVEPAAPL